MSDKKIRVDILKQRTNHQHPFWSPLMAMASLLYGFFIYYYDSYWVTTFAPFMNKLPENELGLTLMFIAVVHLLGHYLKGKFIMKASIIGLSAFWTGLFFVSLTYSFGVGYPSPSYIFFGLMVVGCYRVSLKGDTV